MLSARDLFWLKKCCCFATPVKSWVQRKPPLVLWFLFFSGKFLSVQESAAFVLAFSLFSKAEFVGDSTFVIYETKYRVNHR